MAFPKFRSLKTRAGDVISLRNQFAHRKFNYSEVVDELFKGIKKENISLDTKVAKDGNIEEAPMQLNDKVMEEYLNEIREVSEMILRLSIQIKTKGLKP